MRRHGKVNIAHLERSLRNVCVITLSTIERTVAHLPRQLHKHRLAHWRENVMCLSGYILFRMLSFLMPNRRCLAVLKTPLDEPVKTLTALLSLLPHDLCVLEEW